MPDKSCFVVMGFGEKTHFETQRTLDLDKTYRGIIKPAVEESGLECIRGDDIVQSGVIDKSMYEHLLNADLVIADLSTANPNAIYELGVRHALRPHTTIIIAENHFRFPFDINHVVIRTYEHLGKGIDFEEATRVKENLKTAIAKLVHDQLEVDSPVYVFLDIEKPARSSAPVEARAETVKPDDEKNQVVFSSLLESAQEARKQENFAVAKSLFEKLHELRPADAYITQQLALATYKTKQDSDAGKIAALEEARGILDKELKPATTNDPETLGLWGAIHKRLWDLRGERADLDAAIWAYERAFYLKRDYYNGINYAYVLNVRAAEQADEDEKTADRVHARRVRKMVLTIVDEAEKNLPRDEQRKPLDPAEAYWIAATRLEALKGLGETAKLAEESEKLFARAPESWMPTSTKEQLERLDKLL